MSQPTAAEQHRERTRREFARQAEEFERAGSIFRDADVLDWIAGALPAPSGEQVVLDVAGGTGQLGRRLVRDAGFGVICDLTPQMLQAGARSAREEGQRNVVFAEGDATRLPFAAGQFDLVVTRFALHHIDEPGAALAEMARVCRPGGTIAVVDIARESGEAGRRSDELERLRDPSHARSLEQRELIELLEAVAGGAQLVAEREQRMAAEPWLTRAKPSAEAHAAVLAALEAEAHDTGEPTGLHARLEPDGTLSIAQRWAIATASTI